MAVGLKSACVVGELYMSGDDVRVLGNLVDLLTWEERDVDGATVFQLVLKLGSSQ